MILVPFGLSKSHFWELINNAIVLNGFIRVTQGQYNTAGTGNKHEEKEYVALKQHFSPSKLLTKLILTTSKVSKGDKE